MTKSPIPSYHSRELSSLVHAALRSLPVVVVTGLRQAGKTTFLRNEDGLRDRRYLTLDDFATLEAAQRDPESLLQGNEPLTIDEAQRCPDLLVAIKKAVDERRAAGRFLVSGSANLALLRGVSESLAGRALYLTLHPFTRREIGGDLNQKPFLVRFLERPFVPRGQAVQPISPDEILNGGLPPIVTGEIESRGLWLLGYEQTYLERDVRDLAQVGDLMSFRNVLRLSAFRCAQVLNQSELARDAKLPVSTVSRYLGLLETSFVAARLPPYTGSRSARLIKSPKIFMTDSGLAAHLTGVTNLGAAAEEPMRGALYETYVLQNLQGILEAHLPRVELSFWSVQGRYEVDFVLTSGRDVFAIEVKSGSRFRDGDLRPLRTFAAKTPGFKAGIVAYNGREAHSLGAGLFAVPLGLLLS